MLNPDHITVLLRLGLFETAWIRHLGAFTGFDAWVFEIGDLW